jgi:hypothetical protein
MNKSLPIPKVENSKSSGTAFKKAEGPSFFNPVIQPKLTINQPNDVYEQEADAVADKVIRMRRCSIITDKNTFFVASLHVINQSQRKKRRK